MYRLIVVCAVVLAVVNAAVTPLHSAKFTKYSSRTELETGSVQTRVDHFRPTNNQTFTYVCNLFFFILRILILIFPFFFFWVDSTIVPI